MNVKIKFEIFLVERVLLIFYKTIWVKLIVQTWKLIGIYRMPRTFSNVS